MKCKKVHAVAMIPDSVQADMPGTTAPTDDRWLAAVETGTKNMVKALMHMNDCDVRFQLDSAADVNTICQQFVKQKQARPTHYNPPGYVE